MVDEAGSHGACFCCHLTFDIKQIKRWGADTCKTKSSKTFVPQTGAADLKRCGGWAGAIALSIVLAACLFKGAHERHAGFDAATK